MREVAIFTLERHAGPYETWPTLSRLFEGERWTGQSIRGYVLERQYQLDDGYLLISSDDCPYEEAANFCLLDASLCIRCTRSLWAPYGSYLLETATCLDERRLRVTFHGGEAWVVTITRRLGRPGLQLRRA